jgi:uncharacterized YigZ family protein
VKDYRGVIGISLAEHTVSRSRFIGTAINVSDALEAQEFIKGIKSEYSDATHNCYAYALISGEQKFSDDGEPQSTAGQPILEVIKKKNLFNTAVVVTRYFGGVKLGTGGLVAAYTKAAADCLEKAEIAEFKLSDYVKVSGDYSLKGRLEQVIRTAGGEIVETIYLSAVEITFAIPTGSLEYALDGIAAVSSGQAETKVLYRKYYIYK